MGGDDEGGSSVEEAAPMRFAQHGGARLAGKVVVTEHHVEVPAAQGFQAMLRIARLGHPVALRFQGDGQELPGIVIVLHEEDLAVRAQEGSPALRRSSLDAFPICQRAALSSTTCAQFAFRPPLGLSRFALYNAVGARSPELPCGRCQP